VSTRDHPPLLHFILVNERIRDSSIKLNASLSSCRLNLFIAGPSLIFNASNVVGWLPADVFLFLSSLPCDCSYTVAARVSSRLNCLGAECGKISRGLPPLFVESLAKPDVAPCHL
jgi:hypothetical protein